jgi:hypothetical protein
MTIYGQFEIGELIDSRGSKSVFHARRHSGGGGDFIVKVLAYHSRRNSPGGASAMDHERRCSEFLAAARLQEKAVRAGVRHFAPIHDSGCMDRRAWYATDYYPRSTLKRWVKKGVPLAARDLRSVLARLVEGLLDLQRLEGRSHGNLRPSKILLGGKPRMALRGSPIFLTDLAAAGPDQREAMEKADLRAIGELIYQLVTGTEINSPADYNYPVAASQAAESFARLNDEKDYWLGWCDRLLNPHLSLEECSLELLAKEWRPGARGIRPLIAPSVIILLVLFAGSAAWWFWVSRPPRALDQTVTVAIGEAIGITLSGDSSRRSGALSYEIVDLPAQGELEGDPPTLLYRPRRDAGGTDHFTFTVQAGGRQSRPARVNLVLQPLNETPAAIPQDLEMTAGRTLEIRLEGRDPENARLDYLLTSKPRFGKLLGKAPTLIYEAPPGADGVDQFTFEVTDGTNRSDSATVAIRILPFIEPPIATPQQFTVEAGGSVPITLAGMDPAGRDLQYEIRERPAQGTVTGIPPHITYTAAGNARGVDQFTFVAGNGQTHSAPAGVTLIISLPAIPPIVTDHSLTVSAGRAASLKLTGSHPENAPLRYRVVEQPAKGKLTGDAPDLTYTADPAQQGSDRFTFVAIAGELESAPGVVSIEVLSAQRPPTALAQTVAVEFGATVTFTLKGQDSEGSLLKHRITRPPRHGRHSETLPQVAYTPTNNAVANDTLEFIVINEAGESAPATVTINISRPAPPALVALNQTVVVQAGAAASVMLRASDSDPNVTYEVRENPQRGRLTGSAPQLTYQANENANGADRFTFVARRENQVSEPAEVTINIRPRQVASGAAELDQELARLERRYADYQNIDMPRDVAVIFARAIQRMEARYQTINELNDERRSRLEKLNRQEIRDALKSLGRDGRGSPSARER